MLGNYDLIRVTTQDQIYLHGLYKAGSNSKSAVIVIHGFTSDFYTHNFYHSIATKICQSGNAIILAQTRGTGLNTEFVKTDNSGIYLGSFSEKIEDAHWDITAYVEFLLEAGYKDIVLCGHSLGTIKSVRYLFEGEFKDKISKVILLAPFDKNVFMHMKGTDNWDNYLRIAKDQISIGKGKDTVKVPEWEDFPLSYETFVSWYDHTPLNQIWDFYKQPFNDSLLNEIKIPTCIILGENDECTNYPKYQESSSSVLELLKKSIKNCQTHLIKESNHTYDGHHDLVADLVDEFLNKN